MEALTWLGTFLLNRELDEEFAAEGSVPLQLPHVRFTPQSVEVLNINPVAVRHVVNGSAGAHH